MYPTLNDFCWILCAYMPLELSLQQVLYAFGTILMAQVLLQFKQNQLQQPHQHSETGCDQAIHMLIDIAFDLPNQPLPQTDGRNLDDDSASLGWRTTRGSIIYQ